MISVVVGSVAVSRDIQTAIDPASKVRLTSAGTSTRFTNGRRSGGATAPSSRAASAS
jgi:hypothetical protein